MYQFTLSMYAETHVGLLLKCVLNLTDLNALRKGWVTCCKIFLTSNCYRNIEGRTDLFQ
jgi:hypothetical protein